MDDDELRRTWRINCETTSMLLDGVPDAGLDARYSPRTRTVASQFAHLHNVRVSHLDRRGPKALRGLVPFPRGAQPDRAELEAALAASQEAVDAMLGEVGAAGKVPSWRPGPVSFVGYLAAHEAHHRGLVIVSLRLSGVKLDKDVTYGLWNWSRWREWME